MQSGADRGLVFGLHLLRVDGENVVGAQERVSRCVRCGVDSHYRVRTLAMLVVAAVICSARSSSLWHLGMCMKRAVGVGLTVCGGVHRGGCQDAGLWDGIRGLLTRCG